MRWLKTQVKKRPRCREVVITEGEHRVAFRVYNESNSPESILYRTVEQRNRVTRAAASGRGENRLCIVERS